MIVVRLQALGVAVLSATIKDQGCFDLSRMLPAPPKRAAKIQSDRNNSHIVAFIPILEPAVLRHDERCLVMAELEGKSQQCERLEFGILAGNKREDGRGTD